MAVSGEGGKPLLDGSDVDQRPVDQRPVDRRLDNLVEVGVPCKPAGFPPVVGEIVFVPAGDHLPQFPGVLVVQSRGVNGDITVGRRAVKEDAVGPVDLIFKPQPFKNLRLGDGAGVGIGAVKLADAVVVDGKV